MCARLMRAGVPMAHVYPVHHVTRRGRAQDEQRIDFNEARARAASGLRLEPTADVRPAARVAIHTVPMAVFVPRSLSATRSGPSLRERIGPSSFDRRIAGRREVT